MLIKKKNFTFFPVQNFYDWKLLNINLLFIYCFTKIHKLIKNPKNLILHGDISHQNIIKYRQQFTNSVIRYWFYYIITDFPCTHHTLCKPIVTLFAWAFTFSSTQLDIVLRRH